MFDQEDQLPAPSIITPLESSQSYLQLGSAVSGAIDRVESLATRGSQRLHTPPTVTKLLPI